MFPPQPPKTKPGLQIIHVGFFRTATASMASAYRILGYRADHNLDDVWNKPWGAVEKVAEATWGEGPSKGPVTRADWDAIWGESYDVATDLASPFALELIAAYSDAKVVIVQRDTDKWLHSFETQVLDSIFPRTHLLVLFIARYIVRTRASDCMRKICRGFFGAQDKEGMVKNARNAYEEYYRRVREVVPPERRLEYHVGDGWGPLCEFLGKEVPDVPFPRVNDQEAHAAQVREQRRDMLRVVVRVMGPFVVGGLALAIGWWTLKP